MSNVTQSKKMLIEYQRCFDAFPKHARQPVFLTHSPIMPPLSIFSLLMWSSFQHSAHGRRDSAQPANGRRRRRWQRRAGCHAGRRRQDPRGRRRHWHWRRALAADGGRAGVGTRRRTGMGRTLYAIYSRFGLRYEMRDEICTHIHTCAHKNNPEVFYTTRKQTTRVS